MIDKPEMMADIIKTSLCLEIFKALYAHRKPGLNCTAEISEISDIVLHSGGGGINILKWEAYVTCIRNKMLSSEINLWRTTDCFLTVIFDVIYLELLPK